MMRAIGKVALAATFALLPLAVQAQAGTVRDAIRAQRQAAREARGTDDAADLQVRSKTAIAERLRVENQLRLALAKAVRERLHLTDQQATRLMEVNRRFSDDRLIVARDEMRLRRELRLAVASGDQARSPETARLLDGLLELQRRRLDVQEKEQEELSVFLTPEQRARYIAMMEQLRRRIQARAAEGGR